MGYQEDQGHKTSRFKPVQKAAYEDRRGIQKTPYVGSVTYKPIGKTVLKPISPTIVAGGGTAPPTIDQTGWNQGWYSSNGGPRVSGVQDGSLGANGAIIGATSYSLQTLPLNSNTGTYADVTTTGGPTLGGGYAFLNPRAAGVDGVSFLWVRVRATNAGGDIYSTPTKQTYVYDSGGG